ncbi:competence protein CoiA family protein [Thermomonas fusca]
MWSPKQVASGRECGCVCPACGAPLVAKAADSTCRRPHFAHLAETDCRAGYETALHKKAKELVAEHAVLLLPAWDGETEMPNPPQMQDDSGQWWHGARVEFPGRQVHLENIRLEETQGDYTPDVIAEDGAGELLIEIRVSHAVEPLKRRRIQSEGKRLIEIDLSRLDPDVLLDEARLVQTVLYAPENRVWLACPEATEAWRESFRALKAQVAQRNLQIAELRQRQEDAQKARQRAAEQAQAELAERLAQRERFREQERSRYQAALEDLPALVSDARIEMLLADYGARDGEEAEQLIAQIPSQTVQQVVRHYGPNAWLYQVHPRLWQAACYHRFVLGQAAGHQFNQREVARWVMQRFGRDEVLFSLFRAQYSFRDKARKAGFQKRRISHWAFTDLENWQIPDFYKPINAFVDRLIYAGALQSVPELLGEVRISDESSARPTQGK